jgi:hypothetical protein
MAARRPVPCPYRCRKPVPSTVFVRFHPLRLDAEVRACPECKRLAVFPSGRAFRADWGQSLYVPERAPEGP